MARSLAHAGYPLVLMSREEAKLERLRHEVVAVDHNASLEIITCAKEAAWEADIIIPAVEAHELAEVAEHIRQVAIGKIIVCVSGDAGILKQALPYSKIVKTCGKLPGDDDTDCTVTGEDSEAVSFVSHLMREIGLTPVITK